MLSGYMQRYTDIDTIGLCHSVQVCSRDLLNHVGMTDEVKRPLREKIAGINHMAWLLEIEDADGNDLYPEIRRRACELLDNPPEGEGHISDPLGDATLYSRKDLMLSWYINNDKTEYETQAMEHLFREKGHEIGSFEEPCDGYIINTCSVTAVADKKNRAMIRRCRKASPNAVIGVCGCYSQHAPEAVRELGVDVIGGSADRAAFVEMMLEAMETRVHREAVDNALRRRSFEVLPAGGLEERTRAMLKVQDGCVNFCTYCIIPYTRGPVRSATLETAVEQAKDLAARGYREIVITGIEIASWGVDLPGKPPVTELIGAVCRAVPAMRVRLGSLEPRIVTAEFCEKLCKLR